MNILLNFHTVYSHSMYGIFTYIYHNYQPNVGKYTIHGSYVFSLRDHHGIFPLDHPPPPSFERNLQGFLPMQSLGRSSAISWHINEVKCQVHLIIVPIHTGFIGEYICDIYKYIYTYIICVRIFIYIHIFICVYIYLNPSEGVKFQPLGLFLVVNGLKFHTLGGFRYPPPEIRVSITRPKGYCR